MRHSRHLSSKSGLIGLCLSFGVPLPGHAVTIQTDAQFEACGAFGNMTHLNVHILLDAAETQKNQEDAQALVKDGTVFNSASRIICGDSNSSILGADLKKLIQQRINVINNCTIAIQEHASDRSLSKILQFTKTKTKYAIEIQSIISYGTTRNAVTRDFAKEQAESVERISEGILKIPELVAMPIESAEAIAVGESAKTALKKYLKDQTVDLAKDQAAKRSHVYEYLAYLIANDVYNQYNGNNLPSALKSEECSQ